MLATIGEGGYADGIRARLIRDRLMRIDKATPQDMLSIQLEDRALFLERWRQLLLDGDRVASGDAVAAAVPRAGRDEVDRPRLAGLGRLSPGQGIPDDCSSAAS